MRRVVRLVGTYTHIASGSRTTLSHKSQFAGVYVRTSSTSKILLRCNSYSQRHNEPLTKLKCICFVDAVHSTAIFPDNSHNSVYQTRTYDSILFSNAFCLPFGSCCNGRVQAHECIGPSKSVKCLSLHVNDSTTQYTAQK